MLQRAASNVNSSWWASNVRTKQSKWLDTDVQEMEGRVKSMLKIVEGDGDSFSKKAEIYFKKRPELVHFVEETYKAYKALADKYDHISSELHKANHTIATACPDQVQLEKKDEEDNNLPKAIASLDLKSKENHAALKRSRDSRISSQTSNDNAEEETGRLHKEILILETEKEYIKCSYESGIAKYLDIEKQISDIQEEVFMLQNEFNANVEINDDVTHNLMAATALKSCEDSMVKLQKQQEVVRKEIERIKNAKIKPDTEGKISHEKDEYMLANLSTEYITAKINELVSRVINLELLASSQAAQIDSMKSHADLRNISLVVGNSTANDTDFLVEGTHEIQETGPCLEDLIFDDDLEGHKNHLCAEQQELKIDSSQASDKINEIEKKNQELIEMARQIKELKNANFMKDEEIQKLRASFPNPNDKEPALSAQNSSLEVLFEVSDEDGKLRSSNIEEKYRKSVDKVQEENFEFWLKFCTSIQNIQKFQIIYDRLQAEIKKANPEYVSTCKKLKELKNELQEFLEENMLMQGELESKNSLINSMQEEISNTLKEDVGKFTFKGELFNMQIENNKAAVRLKAGIDRINELQSEIEKTLLGLHEKFEVNEVSFMHSSTKKDIPLRMFLYNAKPKKKQSLFARVYSRKNIFSRINSAPNPHL